MRLLPSWLLSSQSRALPAECLTVCQPLPNRLALFHDPSCLTAAFYVPSQTNIHTQRHRPTISQYSLFCLSSVIYNWISLKLSMWSVCNIAGCCQWSVLSCSSCYKYLLLKFSQLKYKLIDCIYSRKSGELVLHTSLLCPLLFYKILCNGWCICVWCIFMYILYDQMS